ncbi:clostripain-related cysteine peptidase [Nostoc sp. FACHB-190]|uniref:clostripain-related cysteine peptidase n=1 Tax=Nostoc sp. FACHB-190 TaxID=2692838 RepID=UPI0016869B11|nr:clostripain-related cysteine peptidase [Nostoc sp. FACHB-190]MBD2301954.1 hypothetical protein [Nostoc sp. FACHB-190]
MKRRKLIQYGAISSTSFFLNAEILNSSAQSSLASASKSDPQHFDWIILYWMPYDNDLWEFGNPIIEMLTQGIKSPNILVLVQADFSGKRQLSRYIITQAKVDVQQINTANSASDEVFAEYLDWAKSKFQAKKWAIAILGHGGRLDEISPDEHPIFGWTHQTKWMNIEKLSQVITKFNNKLGKRVELLFFQNCNKGTIEAHYTFRDTAKYTLSSQLTLGAPNYYYVSLLEFLGRYPAINGGELATKIIEFEQSDMYYSYTVTHNHRLRDLPKIINPLIDSIMAANTKSINLNEIKFYSYMEDKLVDLVSFLAKITEQSGANQTLLQNFREFIQTSIIYQYKNNGRLFSISQRKEYNNFYGLGCFFPKNQQEIQKYIYLEIFKDVKMMALFTKILSPSS